MRRQRRRPDPRGFVTKSLSFITGSVLLRPGVVSEPLALLSNVQI